MQKTSGSAHTPLGLSQAPRSGHWALSPLPTCKGRGGGGGAPVNNNFHFSPPLLCLVAAFDPELVTFLFPSSRPQERCLGGAGCPWFPGSQVQCTGVRASGPTREGVVRAHRPLLPADGLVHLAPLPPSWEETGGCSPAHLIPHGFS